MTGTRVFVRFRLVKRLLVVLAGPALTVGLLVGCGGDTAGSPDPGETDVPTETDNGGGESGDDADGGSAAAEVVVGDDTFIFDDGTCYQPEQGTVLADYTASDGDQLSLQALPEVTLIRMTLDGRAWTDTGSAESPTVSGDSVDWSGEMVRLDEAGVAFDTTVTLRC